ncbi:RWD domain-containing protein 2A-like [Montipora capricornis]|uniref:RWD domain-containing protein 2A-like n=1 Tax=Montipora capricornis TaxID=246305 RepID=UPI0035F0FFF9
MATSVEEINHIRESLALQISEVEMLRSMYPTEDEFKVDEQVLADIQEFCSGRTNLEPNGLNFSLTISLLHGEFGEANRDRENMIEVSFYIPQEYPNSKPELFARSQVVNREAQRELNDELNSHLSSLERGELCTLPVIQWVQENGGIYIRRSQDDKLTTAECKLRENDHKTKKNGTFLRMWLYMHHIYSKTKRKDILQWACDYDLTGFCLPGKPGVVCLEGNQINVEEYFSRLRRLNWKKITCRHREKGDENLSIDDQRKFSGFDELFFEVHGTRENHMDMGQFLHYLEQHNLGDIFQILFGIEGKSSLNS